MSNSPKLKMIFSTFRGVCSFSSKDRKRLFSSDPNSMKCLSALLWLFFSKRRNAAFFFSLRFSMEEGTDHRSNTPGQVKRFCWPRPPTCSYLNEWNGREKPKKKKKGEMNHPRGDWWAGSRDVTPLGLFFY